MPSREEMNPKVVVVVNSFMSVEKLEPCLKSLMRTDYPEFQVIVIDCKTKGITDWMTKNFPNVQLIHLERDIGPSAQRNVGLSQVNPEAGYIAFIDDDVIVSKDWLSKLIEKMEKQCDIGVVQPKILKESGELDNGGCFIDRVGYVHRVNSVSEKMNIKKKEFDVSYVETAAMLVRSEILKVMDPCQPFDPDYIIHYYDVDFCWRVWLSGYKVVLEPQSIVYHDRGVSGGLVKLPQKNVFLNTRNRFITLVKNYSLPNLLKYLPVALLLESIRITYLLRIRSDHALGNIKGIVWILFHLKDVWRKRVRVQTYRRVPDKSILPHFLKLDLFRLHRNFRRNYAVTLRNYSLRKRIPSLGETNIHA